MPEHIQAITLSRVILMPRFLLIKSYLTELQLIEVTFTF